MNGDNRPQLWQPIETAPRDGRWIVASWSSSNVHAVHVVRWVDTPRAGWQTLADSDVTKYDPALWLMELPALPGVAI